MNYLDNPMNVPVLLPKLNADISPMVAKISWRRIIYPSVDSMPSKWQKSLFDENDRLIKPENVKKYIVYHIKRKNVQNQTLINDDDPMSVASTNRRAKKRIHFADLDEDSELVNDKNVSVDFDEYSDDEPKVLFNKSMDEKLDSEPFEDIKSEILIRPLKEMNQIRSKVLKNGKSMNKKNNFQSETIFIRQNSTPGRSSLTNERKILQDEPNQSVTIKNDRPRKRRRRKPNHSKTSRKFLKIVEFNIDQ